MTGQIIKLSLAISVGLALFAVAYGQIVAREAEAIDNTDRLRSVIIAARLSELSKAEQTWLKDKLKEYTGQADSPLKTAKVYYLNGNKWHIDWWSVKQFRKTQKDVTLAKVKTALNYEANKTRIKIAVAPWGEAEEVIAAAGFTNVVEVPE